MIHNKHSEFALHRPWPLILCLLIVILVIREAWFCDDSFFTIRSSLNLRYGYGPVWNPGERVQSFTNPLWMILISFAPAALVFNWTVALSVLLVAVNVTIMAWMGRPNPVILAAVLLLLLSSWVFIDYGTSGLETPLSGFFVALSLGFSTRQRVISRSLLWSGIIAGLSYLSRPDLIIITFIDPLLRLILENEFSIRAKRQKIVHIALGASLVLMPWFCLSVMYYGFPFPVTAYAKLGQDLERLDVLRHGVGYALTFFLSDISGSLVILLSLALPIRFAFKKKGNFSLLAIPSVVLLGKL